MGNILDLKSKWLLYTVSMKMAVLQDQQGTQHCARLWSLLHANLPVLQEESKLLLLRKAEIIYGLMCTRTIVKPDLQADPD